MQSVIDGLKNNEVSTQYKAYNKIVSRTPEQRELEKLLREAEPTWKQQKDLVPISVSGDPIPKPKKQFPIGPLPGASRSAEGSAATVEATPIDFELIALGAGSVQVRAGTVKTSTSSILPDGMTTGDVTPFVLATGTDGYVLLQITVDPDTGVVSDADVIASASILSDTATTGYLVLGTYGTSGSEFTVGGAAGSQAYLYCGGVHYFWRA